MLSLTRELNQTIRLTNVFTQLPDGTIAPVEKIDVTVGEIRKGRVRLWISAPHAVAISRIDPPNPHSPKTPATPPNIK